MLFGLINKCVNFVILSGRILLSKVIRKFKIVQIIIGLGLLLQGISIEVFADWVNFWPFAVCEDTVCDRCFHKETYLGPLIEQKYTEIEHVAAIRPIGAHIDNYQCNESFDYFLYPLFTHIRTQCGSSWNMFLLSGCSTYDKHKMTLFPLFFKCQTCDPCTSYCAVFPIGGAIRNHFCFDTIRWFMFPLYLGLERKCTIRHGLPWPFIRWQTGPCSGGGALWPLAGYYWREGDYNHSYMLWPLIYKFCDCLSSPTPSYRIGFLPFYAYENSAKREMTTIIWPFFSHIEMHDRCYVEDQFLWPFFVQGRGECEYVNRWAPFYTHSIRRGKDKRWVLWPLFKVQHWNDQCVSVTQKQILYFLFWKQCQRRLNDPCGPEATKMHFWPFYSYWDNGAGQKQFQFLSPLEVFFPANKAVRNIYSPLFAIFRHEQIAPGHTRQSLLFDLIASETAPCYRHFSIGPFLDVKRSPCEARFEILKGLLGFKCENGKKSLKFLWITF